MIKSFEITNFKSFKDTTFFDFNKTNYQMLSDTHISNNILKGLMFVGANASGKSNAILAVKFLLDSLLGKNDINFASYHCLFSPDPATKLKYIFSIDNTDVQYEITYQTIDEYIQEKLFVDNVLLFERNGSFAKVNINEETTHSDVPNKTLFLRDIYFNTKFRGNSVLQKWFKFLSDSVYIDLYSKKVTTYKDINLNLKSYLDEKGTDEINQFFNEYNFEQNIEYSNISQGGMISIESVEKMIFYKRKGINEPIPFPLESLGNQTLLQILPTFFYCIKSNSMLLLDEFSSGFHNDLEELLIRYFMQKSTSSQVLFVSHSTNLLSNRLLRPDQIYSIDFNENGSLIKRFSSEKPREAQNLEKMYLSGVFNGVPKYDYNS
ncbi:MAG: AAA family ATPase [Acutalibacteraceae bacterium]|nr:AAA family ATPase [Acutalibacteraceae bacterium]